MKHTCDNPMEHGHGALIPAQGLRPMHGPVSVMSRVGDSGAPAQLSTSMLMQSPLQSLTVNPLLWPLPSPSPIHHLPTLPPVIITPQALFAMTTLPPPLHAWCAASWASPPTAPPITPSQALTTLEIPPPASSSMASAAEVRCLTQCTSSLGRFAREFPAWKQVHLLALNLQG